MKAQPPHELMKRQLPPPVLMASQEATKSHQDSNGGSVPQAVSLQSQGNNCCQQSSTMNVCRNHCPFLEREERAGSETTLTNPPVWFTLLSNNVLI